MRQYSWKFWIGFWVIAAIFLTGWFFFWQWNNKGLEGLDPLVGVLPIDQATKTDVQTLSKIADAVLVKDGRERVYLILLQNNTELRPGGGYIGSFAILKVRDGAVTEFAVHDTNIFDGREPTDIPPPYPMHETLNITSWQMRDSNWSPDFPTNALKAEEMYHLGNGGEQFDAIIGVTTETLVSILRLTGDITLPDYGNKTFSADTVVGDLEYQVEQQWWKDGQGLGERKQAIRALGDGILARVKGFGLGEKQALFQTMLVDLHQKDIQVYFKDEAIQNEVVASGWSGRIDTSWTGDSLLVIDANLSALNTDRVMDRHIDYTVDMTGSDAVATLAITYRNNGTVKDWRTTDYQSYVRAYVPDGSWLVTALASDGDKSRQGSGVGSNPTDLMNGAVTYGSELGRKYFGVLVHVPLGSERTVTFTYKLPPTLQKSYYDLLVDKQAGVDTATVDVHILRVGGAREDKSFALKQTLTLGGN